MESFFLLQERDKIFEGGLPRGTRATTVTTQGGGALTERRDLHHGQGQAGTQKDSDQFCLPPYRKGKCILSWSLATDAGSVSVLQIGDNYEDLHSYFHFEQNKGVLAFCEKAWGMWMRVPPASPESGSSTSHPQVAHPLTFCPVVPTWCHSGLKHLVK